MECNCGQDPAAVYVTSVFSSPQNTEPINKYPAASQAVYGVLKEAEHRSTFYIPYWNLPFAKNLVPRQRLFYADLAVINDCLDDLISQAKNTRQTGDAEALQARDYSKVRNGFRLFCVPFCFWTFAMCARQRGS